MNESETNELEVLRKRIRELELDAEEPTTRGHKKVTQIIAGKKIYFCRTSAEEQIFSENHPGVETETFHIELLNSTAEKYLNDPENIKQFTSSVEVKEEVKEEVTAEPAATGRPTTETESIYRDEAGNPVKLIHEAVLEVKPDLTWRQQAKELGIPLHKEPPGSGMRKKEDVLADIIAQISVSTSVS